MKPHKHAELIKAWADGAEIQAFSHHGKGWVDSSIPSWCSDYEYRIKPQPKPDEYKYLYVGVDSGGYRHVNGVYSQDIYRPAGIVQSYGDGMQLDAIIKLTIDGDTNKPKSVELL